MSILLFKYHFLNKKISAFSCTDKKTRVLKPTTFCRIITPHRFLRSCIFMLYLLFLFIYLQNITLIFKNQAAEFFVLNTKKRGKKFVKKHGANFRRVKMVYFSIFYNKNRIFYNKQEINDVICRFASIVGHNTTNKKVSGSVLIIYPERLFLPFCIKTVT